MATLEAITMDYESVEGQLLGKLTEGGSARRRPAGPPPPVPDHALIRRIGSGSYGDVWLARNVVGTYRAVKVVYRGRFGSARPFEREFHGMQRYEPVSRRHEGLVDILHIGRNDPAGFFYYVMELADDASAGPPLAALSENVRRAAAEAGRRRPGTPTTTAEGPAPSPPLPEIVPDTYRPRTLASEIRRTGRLAPMDCVQVFLTLTAALGTLHRAGLLHRDIKPSNIILVGGMAKLADIGLVAEAGAELTFVGTEGFIPPEGPGTAAADLYALGKMFYEAFTGLDRMQFPSLPASPDNLVEMKALLELGAVANKACASEPARRYASAEELLADLALLHSGRSVQRLRQVESRLRRARRFGLAAAAAALVTGTASVFVQAQRSRELRTRATLAVALADARLHRAVAERIAGQPGSRFAVLAAAAEAARNRPGDPDLRSAAITALAHADVRESSRRASEMADPLAFAWNASADTLAVALADGTIRVERPHGAAPVFVRGTVPLRPHSLDRSGRWLLALDAGSDPQLWDLSSGTPTWQARAHRDAAALDPEGRWLLVVPARGTPERLDLARGDRVPIPEARPEDAPALLSNIHAGRVVVAQPDGPRLHLVDLAARAVVTRWKLPAGAATFGLALAPDGQRVFAGSVDFRVFVLDAREPDRPPVLSTAHQGAVLAGAFSPDGEMFFSTAWDYSTRLFETATGREVTRLPWWSLGLGFGPDGRSFRRVDGVTTRLLDYEYGASVCRVRSVPAPARGLTSPGGMLFAADGTWMAMPSWDGIRLYDPASANLLASLQDGHPALSLARSEDDSITAASYQRLRRWSHGVDASTQVFGPPGAGEERELFMIAGDRSGRTLAVASRQGVLRRTRTDVTEPLEDPVPASGRAYRLVAVSPDGRWIAGGQVGDLAVWDATTRRRLWKRPSEWESLPVFSPDGNLVAHSDRHQVVVIEVATQRVLWSTPQPDGAGIHGAWSPDGLWLVLARRPDSLTAFEARTGAVWGEIRHSDARLLAGAAFSPDGRQLVVATTSGVIQWWQLPELRAGLAEVGLDFPLPPFPPAPGPTEPVRLRVSSSP